MECPNCRSEVSEQAKFCSQCGHALARICPSCGNRGTPGAKLCLNCGASLPGSSVLPGSLPIAPILPPRAASAERIHLTVMFCDLVGSTALSVNLDIEDLHDLIGAYHRRVAEIVARFGGFVARRVGDGALIYFGYPNADEDDPEQALRAGLAVIEGVRLLENREPVEVRLGIATGLAVVGDLIGSGLDSDKEVLGEVPNLAARLLALAEPSAIVIADSTRRLIGSVFALEDLGFKELKGFTEPQRAWRVLGENRFKSRFEALRSAELPLVNRQEEIELLLRRWAQARAGEGRVILFSGEPGIGKSRLTVALKDSVQPDFIELQYFCSPHHQHSALYPIITLLERTAHFERDDAPAAKLDKLEAVMARTSASKRDVALLADLLLLPTARYPAIEQNPRRRKEETFEALMHQFTALAQSKPVLISFEDLHWMDPTTREFLDLLIRKIRGLSVLLVATFRPDFIAPWVDQPHVTLLNLNRLTRTDSEALVRQLAANATSFSSELIAEIVERGDGVPLFLEEVTKTVVDAGSEPPAGSPGLRPSLSVPPTLHASLMARLDRVGGAAKEIAQIGAAIGREFPYELTAVVAERPESELKETLGRLVDAGVLFRHGEPPRSTFLFKHGLLQDAAYSTLLRGPRRNLHARIAQAIEKMFPDLVQSQPEVVARHRTEAGLKKKATVDWQRAGELALRRSAGNEALKHFSTALRLLEELPDATDRWQQELEIRLGLGTALIAAQGFRSAGHDIVKHYARAVALGRGLRNDKTLFRAMWGNWYGNLITGQTDRALGLANELVELAERLSDPDLMLEAYHSRWANSHVLGLNSLTLNDAQRGIALYDPERHHAHAYEYGGHDTGVCAYAHSAMTLWITGSPEQAVQTSARTLELGQRLGHPPSLVHAAWWSATLRQLRRETAACRELADLTIRIGREQGSNVFVTSPLLLGWALFESGQVSDGLQRMDEAVSATRQSVRRFYFDYELLVFAEALLKTGELDRAQQAVEEALESMTTSRNRLFEAEAHRLAGLSLLRRGADQNAEARLFQAMETAEQQGALSFKLRAATSLSRLWLDRNRPNEAYKLLSQVYNRFNEGFDTADLKEAKALLNDLG